MTDDVANDEPFAGGTPPLLDGKRIAIVGAGPCGLTLARLLQQAGADVQVFELESSAIARNQGGSLDLHEDSGQLAIHKAGLYEQFRSLCRPEGQALKVMDKHGTLFIDLRPTDEADTRPEIDRGTLRGLLIDSLAQDTIQWDRQLEGVGRSAEGRLRLIFSEGPHIDADLLFGCDGAWSRVRPFVSATKPYYCGITTIEAWISSVDTQHPEVSELVGPGTMFATSDDKGVIGQRNGDGNVRLYITLRVPEDWITRWGIDFNRPELVEQGLLEVFEGWAPEICELFKAPYIFIARPLYTHPIKQAAWYARSDVTLLGDAAHVMPFFTGRGVNLAMLDAVELAESLTSGKFAAVGEAIQAYETGMFARMAVEIDDVLSDQDVFLSPVAPTGIEDLLQRRIAKAQERLAASSEAKSDRESNDA